MTGSGRRRRLAKSDKSECHSWQAVTVFALKGDWSIASRRENSSGLSVPETTSSGARTCDNRGQRLTAIALGSVLVGKDVLAECDQFESTSHGTRNRDAPMPASILFEHMEGGQGLARRC